MADFSAVLKKTIDALSENSPEARERVYQKARMTIENKLASVKPAPSAAVVERQRKLLEDAIAKVEAEYAPPPAPEEPDQDELDQIFAELDVDPVKPADPLYGNFAARPDEKAPAPVETGDAAKADDGAKDPVVAGVEEQASDRDRGVDGPEAGLETPPPPPRAKGRKGVSGGLIAALLLLVAIAAGAWFYKDDLAGLVGGGGEQVATDSGEAATPAAGESSGDDGANTAAAGGEDATAEPAAPEPARKFTQRLLPDGREVDDGPAGGQPGVGEGTSVAQATQTGDEASQGAPAQNGDAGADQALPVGQKAIFYEERTSVSQGSADVGAVVWSVVQESPGNDLPPEPAIRAEATIPQKNLQLKMTIRRNADESLPASHIMEVIFLTPDEFEGGSIDNVLRVSLKRSEQDTGNPLLGIPAKIADGFFLVALSDSAADIETNLLLLRRQRWIDIPIVYKSGRRALITLEKGIPGEKVFNDVLAAWQNATSG